MTLKDFVFEGKFKTFFTAPCLFKVKYIIVASSMKLCVVSPLQYNGQNFTDLDNAPGTMHNARYNQSGRNAYHFIVSTPYAIHNRYNSGLKAIINFILTKREIKTLPLIKHFNHYHHKQKYFYQIYCISHLNTIIFIRNAILKLFSLLKKYCFTPRNHIFLTQSSLVINTPFLKIAHPRGIYYEQYDTSSF